MQKIIVLLKVVFLFCFFLLMGCRKDVSVNKVTENTDTTTVALLLQKANDFNLSKEERLKFIHQAERELNKINQNDSLTRSYYLKLAGRYYNIQESENYFLTTKKLYQLALDSKDTLYIAKSFRYLGDFYYDSLKNDSAFYYYTKAEKAFSKLIDNDDFLRVKYNKANILLYGKNYYDCEAIIIDLLKIAKTKKDFRLVYDCYISLGLAQDGINDLNHSLEYFNKSLEVLNELKNDIQYLQLQAQSYNYIGKSYTKKREFKKAIYYYEKALTKDNLGETNLQLYTAIIINKSYSNLKIGNLKQSKKEVEEALQISKKLNFISEIVSSKLVLSEYYLQQKQLDSCIQNSIELTQLAHDNRIFEDELKGLAFLLKLAPPEKANYAERYIKLSDSLQNAERINQNKFARIKFETKEILDQRDSIQQERDKIATQRWSILAVSTFVIGLLLLSIFAIVQHSKNKRLLLEQEQQQANEEIYKLMLTQQNVANETRKKEQKRISQELHDGIMSKLTSTRLNLFILNKKNDEETIKKCLEHVNGIQDIEKEIRSISHNLNHSSLLDQDTFETMIYDLFEKFKETTGIDHHISLDDKINWNAIDNSKKINLYRILQESLQNVYKYAAATFVELDVLLEEDKLKIVILDNGKGFDSSKVKAGIGLKNMNSRVESMFGKFEINSKEGDGTTIIIEIPLKNES